MSIFKDDDPEQRVPFSCDSCEEKMYIGPMEITFHFCSNIPKYSYWKFMCKLCGSPSLVNPNDLSSELAEALMGTSGIAIIEWEMKEKQSPINEEFVMEFKSDMNNKKKFAEALRNLYTETQDDD